MTKHQQLLADLAKLVDKAAKEVCETKEAYLFDAPGDPEAEAAFQLARDLHGHLLDAKYRMEVRLKQQEREQSKYVDPTPCTTTYGTPAHTPGVDLKSVERFVEAVDRAHGDKPFPRWGADNNDLGLCSGFNCDKSATTVDEEGNELCASCLNADPNAGKWQ